MSRKALSHFRKYGKRSTNMETDRTKVETKQVGTKFFVSVFIPTYDT